MKKTFMILALLLLSVGAAWAQYAGTVGRTGTTITVNGEKLTPEKQAALLADVNGTDYNPAWQKAKAGRNTGMWLTIGGGVVILGGSVASLMGVTASLAGASIGAIVGSIGGEQGAQQGAQSGATAGKPLATGGLIAAGAGVVAMAVGIPTLVSNNRSLNGIVDKCNTGRTGAQLSLVPTGNGLGLVLEF